MGRAGARPYLQEFFSEGRQGFDLVLNWGELVQSLAAKLVFFLGDGA
jgi:hypothetical protein